MECGHDVIVTSSSASAAAITETEWCPVKNVIDEACMLFHNFSDSLESQQNAVLAAVEVRPVMEFESTTGRSITFIQFHQDHYIS